MHSHSSSLADDYYAYTQSSPPASSTTHARNPSSTPDSPGLVRKQASLAQIAVPSFSAFRSQVAKQPHSQAQTSPRAASFSLIEKASPPAVEPELRPLSLDSPLLQQPSGLAHLHSPPLTEERETYPPSRSSYNPAQAAHERTQSIDSRITSTVASSTYSSSPRHSADPIYEGYAHDRTPSHDAAGDVSGISGEDYYASPERNHTGHKGAAQAPTMTVEHFDGPKRSLSNESLGAASTSSHAERPKSPIGRLGNFFGWKSPQNKSEGDYSPSTTFSERSPSPSPSPNVKTMPLEGSISPARLTPHGLDVHKANNEHVYFDNPETPLLLGSGATNAHVRELERELAYISQELAGSIRREMELEDELDRTRAEYPSAAHTENGSRGSDYFSDSGTSSARFPITDMDGKLEQLEKQVRKVEQEKANAKVETAARLQTELGRRRDLEELVRSLEDQLERKNSADEQRGNVDDRLSELESTLDETRRRLGQEKEAKENLEELHSATQGELELHRNERDNLRDEILPQLRARVEGLESDAADTQSLVYENTRMQQELVALRAEHQNIKDANQSRFNSEGVTDADRISEMKSPRIGLSRSGSLARSTSLRRGNSVNYHKPEGGRQRSGSNSVVAYPDGVKEIEDQRDALHQALKLLLSRYERQRKTHERAIKKLSTTRGGTATISPKRSAYSREVAFLKEEVTVLRKRTEDALEQKWQYEKGLSGLKMDLDAAEQETRGLRILLHGHDITAASPRSPLSDEAGDEKGRLRLSISAAENERDQARKVASDYRQRASTVVGASSAELMNSANRMEELADQLESQVQSNVQLRDRLADAVAKGEQEQKVSTRQIEEMQKRLAGMEDDVLAAQQHSENTLADHDSEVRKIEDATSPRLQRLRIDIPDADRLSPMSPLLRKSPKLLSKKLNETSLLEVSQTQMLQRKIRELEGLLREAEEDVQLVVRRVNQSQMEVNDLQTERDAALTQMRKLQALVVEERERAEALM